MLLWMQLTLKEYRLWLGWATKRDSTMMKSHRLCQDPGGRYQTDYWTWKMEDLGWNLCGLIASDLEQITNMPGFLFRLLGLLRSTCFLHRLSEVLTGQAWALLVAYVLVTHTDSLITEPWFLFRALPLNVWPHTQGDCSLLSKLIMVAPFPLSWWGEERQGMKF